VELACASNRLETIDVSTNYSLEDLDFQFNELTNVDLSHNGLLHFLNCSRNLLTDLELKNNPSLYHLDCGQNLLNTLDISGNDSIGQGYRTYSSGDLILSQMPTLGEVCVWQLPFPPEGVDTDTTGSPNIYFTTGCSK